MNIEKNLGFDLQKIVMTFDLSYNENCDILANWLNASYSLDATEFSILKKLHHTTQTAGIHMNEEELKAKVIALVFLLADIEVSKKIMVFYERPLSGKINDFPLSVICDCLVASPVINAPQKPYFFLQELKKNKGEKKDPEAQMLIAMLLAQQINNDAKPVYGSFLLGTNWHFTTLVNNDYCVSRNYDLTKEDELLAIIYALKNLKELIINR
jgi:hypothetical protein